MGLQWSRPQLRTETSSRMNSPVSATGLQWSRPQLRTETGRRSTGDSVDRIPASMEPSSVEDGNRACGFLFGVKWCCFNGAVLS